MSDQEAGQAESTQSLHIEHIALSEVVAWPRNPKEHALPELQASMRRFGFVAPILIDERSGMLVAGHGRVDGLRIMKVSNRPPPERVRVRETDGEWLVPVIRGISFSDEAEMEAYALADNQLTMKTGWRDAMLARVISGLADRDLLGGTGFDESDRNRLLDKIAKEQLAGDLVPEMELQPYESYDYIMVVCRTTWDWDQLVERLALDKRAFTATSGSVRKVGLCHVIDGAQLIRLLES